MLVYNDKYERRQLYFVYIVVSLLFMEIDTMGQYFSNEKLESNMKKYSTKILDHVFTFHTDNGVFCKDYLDFGTRLLLESIPLSLIGDSVLDVGCGYGVIGITIAKLTGATIDMVDVNHRAMHLAKMNIKENMVSGVTVFESNCYENVTKKYQTIITNPPIRAGKKIVYDIVMNARNHLLENGHLFLVIRKDQGAKSLIVDMEKYYNVEVLEKSKGFFIIKCSL